MNRTVAVFHWINAVRADRRLRAGSCVRVALQLVENISAAEFGNSGRMLTWQSMPRLASAAGLQVRAVRYVLRRLEATGYLSTDVGGGRKRSSHYTLTLPETRQADAGFIGQKPGTPLPALAEETRQSHVVNPAKRRPKTRHARAGESLKETLKNLKSNDSDTVDRPAPRQRADALGAGLNGQSRLGGLGEPLRRLVNDGNFQAWFVNGEAELVEHTADTITLAVKSKFYAIQIENRFERQILACAPGAVWLHVVVRDAKPRPEAAP
ncbi:MULTISPECIES: hypothetical protein [unclassified Bradyrhizobium]